MSKNESTTEVSLKPRRQQEEEKSIYKMKLHESMNLKGKDIYVLRVPGGWIYTSYHLDRLHTEYRATSTFVPLIREPKENQSNE